MEEYPLYYDWNTGQALQPWAWLLEDEEEWEFTCNNGVDYHIDLMTMDSSYIESRGKSIRLPSVDKTSKSQKSVSKPVDKSVDKLCKNRKIVINKTK